MEEINGKTGILTVSVKSFSFHRGIPYDSSGNGGGFVFDCRALNNPGKYDEYKCLTGKDESVKSFLLNKSHVLEFLDLTQKIVFQSVKEYLQLGYNHLDVNFGCTGGQHRSVFCAEAMAVSLKNAFPHIKVELNHLELEKKFTRR